MGTWQLQEAKARLSEVDQEGSEGRPAEDHGSWGTDRCRDFEQGVRTAQAPKRQFRRIHAQLTALRLGA